MERYNPFRPGSIVTPGMFCGRYPEFVGTERALFQTKNGNPHHFLIHGERGIGKSSLLFSLELVARGRLDAFEGGKFNFLTLSLELEPENTYSDLIAKVGAELGRAVAARDPGTELLRSTWDFLKRSPDQGDWSYRFLYLGSDSVRGSPVRPPAITRWCPKV